MDLELRDDGDVTIVTVYAPEIDASHAEEFKHALAAVVGRQPRTVIDLSRVEFVDSSGLGAIATMRLRLAEGGELALCGAREPIATLLRVARIDKVFPTFASVEEGVAALAGTA
ncbi:MAG: STAS domain-containing protein [Planctomycetota bacterium]|jgi:anti-sigma B factor antagonist